jgi:arsenate reductase (glutaredoxin)
LPTLILPKDFNNFAFHHKSEFMLTIYHNPRCKKSRSGLEFLQNKTKNFTLVDYIKNPLKTKELATLLMKLNKKPQEMVRTQEEYFKKELKGQQFNDDEWVKIIVENPKLLKRPIVVRGNKAVWADPAEEIEHLF